jgi:glycosyltransferase involved in cell wall biosynthesis
VTSGDTPEVSPTPMRRVVAILTAHNRRELTLACLRSYFSQKAPSTELRAVVVDDGGSDGTTEAVSKDFPAAKVIVGPGDLFWARGMATAESVASRSAPDYLIWLNDDASLYPDALRGRWRLLQSRKGRLLGSQVRFLQRHGGPFRPIYILLPYVRLLAGCSFAAHGSANVNRNPVGSPL